VWPAPSSHTEWMYDDHPTYRRLAAELVRFLDASLRR
jgi:hypothetical protein